MNPRMISSVRWRFVAAMAVLLAGGCQPDQDSRSPPAKSVMAAQPPLPKAARQLETLHYRIHSTAAPVHTTQMAQAVEHLYTAYTSRFPATSTDAKLSLVLYRDRDEFRRHNRSAPWAEGYYLWPRSHAYFDSEARNPYHWMLHEATHQLTREVSGFSRRNRWIDEGLATYFSTSRLDADGLYPGEIDANTYPIWWLKKTLLGGDRARDLAGADFISIDQLLTGAGAPDINRHFNQYYICAWSLTHFLIHYDQGKYAEGHRQLVASGGGAAEFAALVGPLEQIEAEWYPYLLQQIEAQRLP